jgi:hypothetical protein
MKRLFHSATASVGLLVALMFGSGTSAAGYAADQDFGSPGHDNVYERVITISPNARWVNVNRDETIKFIDASSGKSFVWHFKTPADRFDLSKVAPAGILSGRQIDAYIGPSSRETSTRF